MKQVLGTVVQLVSAVCTFVLVMSFFRYLRCGDPKHSRGRSQTEIAEEKRRYRKSMLASVLICVATLVLASLLAASSAA